MKRKVRVFDLLDDPVNHPGHYTNGGIECIDAIQAAIGLKMAYNKTRPYRHGGKRC